MATYEPARAPEDLGRLFLERANAGDVAGVVALYEPDAVLAFPAGRITRGHEAIRAVYTELFADGPTFDGDGRPALRSGDHGQGDLALTSTVITGGITAEIARRQPDGTWRWAVDQPAFITRA